MRNSVFAKPNWIPWGADIAVLLLVLVFSPKVAFAAPAARPIVIKIGISEYQNIEETYLNHQKFFYVLSDLLSSSAKNSGADVAVFEISVGSYDEVVDWWNRGQIDAAVLAATPVATLIASNPDSKQLLAEAYVGTLGEKHIENDPERPLLNAFCQNKPGCTDSLAEQRKKDGARFFYRSLAFVNTDQIQETDFSKARDRIKRYLFVRPASASGYLVPFAFLSGPGVLSPESLKAISHDPSPGSELKREFTYQHPTSTIELLGPEDPQAPKGPPTVAFIYDSVHIPGNPEEKSYQQEISRIKAKLRKLDGAEFLDKTLIPFNALFVNYNVASHQRTQKILSSALQLFNSEPAGGSDFTRGYLKTGNLKFKRLDSWLSSYDGMVQILGSPNHPPEWSPSGPVSFSASQIADELHGYSDCDQAGKCRQPRLAVVFSGGGAKCAYQVGALEGIEKVLENRRNACEANSRNDQQRANCAKIFNIDLLVGTSGGSINALLAAAGNTNKASGRSNIERIWGTLNQNDLVEPTARLKLWMATSFGLLQAFGVTVLVAIFATSKWNWFALIDVILGLCVLLLSAIFFLSGGQFVPVVLLVELLLVIAVILVQPRVALLRKIRGRHPLRILLVVLLLESFALAYVHGQLNTSSIVIILTFLGGAAVMLALVAGLTRYLLKVQAINHLKILRIFAAIAAIVLAVLKLITSLHASSLDSSFPRILPYRLDIPGSYAIPIFAGLAAQLLVFTLLVLIDFRSGKLRKVTDWRFYAILVFLIAALLVPIPGHGAARKELVVTSAQVISALFLLQGTVWIGFFITNRGLKKGPMHWWTAASIVTFMVSVFEFCIALIWVLMDYWSPTTSHWILHLGLIFIKLLVFRGMIAAPVLVGLAMIFIPRVFEFLNIQWDWNQRRAMVVATLAGVTITICALVTGVMFFLEVSLSGSSAIANTFSESMPSVVAGLDIGTPSSNPEACSDRSDNDSRMLCQISRRIIEKKSIQRDLLITASRLHEHRETGEPLPDDLYFYYRSSEQRVPRDRRFVPLRKNPDLLLDAVIGSSTIYPVFPTHELKSVCLRKEVGTGFEPENLEIIDGGFIHNSPVEAAVSWGATHIILIEATADEIPRPAQNFGKHVLKAFDYLYSQAQRTDVSSKGSVELFELRPNDAMDVLDFSPKLVQLAIERGKKDASESPTAEPKFHRTARAPSFREQYQPDGAWQQTPSRVQWLKDENEQECTEPKRAAATQNPSN